MPLSLHTFVPVFPSIRQRGAYGLIRNGGGQMLVVQGRAGRWYLPGGRIEPGESARSALGREIAEECGWAAQVSHRLADEEQMIFGGSVRLAASYWQARLVRPLALVPEHVSSWIAPAEAAARLHRDADRRIAATIVDNGF